jgi:hypothetical protein
MGGLETIPTTNSAFSPTPVNFETGILVATDAPHAHATACRIRDSPRTADLQHSYPL